MLEGRQFLNDLFKPLCLLRGYSAARNFTGHLEIAKLRPRVTKLGQSNLSRHRPAIGGLDHDLVIDIADQPIFLDANLERIPFSWTVVFRRLVKKHFPAKNIGPLEKCKPQLASGRVKPVVPVLSVTVKDQPGSTCFIIKPHLDGNLVGNLREVACGETEATAGKPLPRTADQEFSATLLPAGPEEGLPVTWINHTDCEPAIDRYRVGFFQ